MTVTLFLILEKTKNIYNHKIIYKYICDDGCATKTFFPLTGWGGGVIGGSIYKKKYDNSASICCHRKQYHYLVNKTIPTSLTVQDYNPSITRGRKKQG